MDKLQIHASGEDYLEAVLMLQKKIGMVRSVDIARHMRYSKPSVSHAVGILRDGGFLIMDQGGFLHLTDAGLEIAKKSTSVTAFSPRDSSNWALIPKGQNRMPAESNTPSAMKVSKS